MFKRLTKASLTLAVAKLTLLVLTAALPVPAQTVASAAESPKRVLTFSSDDQFMPGVTILHQSIRSTLTNGTPGQVQFFFEAQDSLRISAEKYEEEMVRLLKRTYEGERMNYNKNNFVYDMNPAWPDHGIGIQVLNQKVYSVMSEAR